MELRAGRWDAGRSAAIHMCNCRSGAWAAIVLLSAWLGSAGMDAARGEMESVRTIRVHAEAEAAVPIDRAVVRFALISEGKTPGEAQQRDESRFGDIRKRVDGEWGGKAAWKTSEIRLQPVMAEGKGKKEGKERTIAYRVTRREAIELAEFSQLGGLLAVLFAAGVDEVSGVEWLSNRLEPLYRELLGKALEKARGKAELLAKAAGAQLGPVLNIQEGPEPARPLSRLELEGAASGVAQQGTAAVFPVSGGEMRIQASVQVVFRLW